MIRFENTEIYGWEAAIRGLRNPKNSWDKSDTSFELVGHADTKKWTVEAKIGENDMKLMKALRCAGSDHRKYLRFITVSVDITAPLYWWKEFDTYKVGTVANSCSTMHKIHAKEFTLDDFSHEHLYTKEQNEESLFFLEHLISGLNFYRRRFIETKNKEDWWQMIQLLPTSYNQKRTVLMNYEVLNNIARSRKDHKLDEWREGFMGWIKTLPYANELICA